ncbi:MPHOSPH9 isoform 4, partial [Pan troglodytes]
MEEFDLVKTLHKTSSSVGSDENSLHSLGLNLNTDSNAITSWAQKLKQN